MEPVQSQEKDANTHQKGDMENDNANNRKLYIVTIGTMIATSLIGSLVVVILTIYGESGVLAGYLNSIPRIVERRDAYLSGTDALYSRDFNVRGEIAAMIYDNSNNEDPRERITAAKEAVGAAGVALIDQGGNVVADTENTDVVASSGTASRSEDTVPDASTDDQDSERAGDSVTLDVGDIDQVISSEENLVIISEDAESGESLKIDVAASQTDSDESDGNEEESKDSKKRQLDEAKAAESVETEEAEEAEEDESSDSGSTGKQAEEVTVALKSATEEKESTEGETETSSNTYVYYRANTQDGSTLVVKFEPTSSLKLNQEEGQWVKLLDRLVAGIDAYAFVREDDSNTWTAYPISSMTKEQTEALSEELAIIEEHVTFKIPQATKRGYEDIRFGIREFFGKPFLVGTRPLPDRGLTFVMAVPFTKFFPGALRSCLAVTAIFFTSVILFLHYIRVVRSGMSDECTGDELVASLKVSCRGGLAVMVVVLTLFSFMSILLSKSATTALTARTQRESLSYELSYQESIIDQVLDENDEAVVTQTKALATLLSEQPQLRTRSGLKRLADIVGARYLMLFDKSGKELFSSNSYVGFQIAKDEGLSVETIVDAPGLQAMLLGETCVVSDPIEDRQGDQYRVIAALVVDAEGLPDGFLVMASESAHVGDAYTDDLSPLMNREGQVAMVADVENDSILKDSDVSKVGEPVSAYLKEDVLGRSYEGYTWYGNQYVYMSSDIKDNMSTIVISLKIIGVEDLTGLSLLVTLSNLLIILFYYPIAIKYCCLSKRPLKPSRLKSPLSVFLYGYVFFFCCLSIVAYVSSSRGNWPAFSAVFDGSWSRGLNQFSIWSAVFFTSQAASVITLVKHVLKRMTEKSSMASRTLIRLLDSLITYVSVIAITLVDLTWFGVDTTALIASAGIVSIAVGMGAKDLIADILAGAFIIFESSVRVGDIVQIEGWRGTVTDIGIRTCEITDRNNNVKVVNNSQINNLINYSRKSTNCTMEFEISREVSLEELPNVVDSYINELTLEVPEVANSLHFVEVTSITDDFYKVAVSWSCDESKREGLTFRLNNAIRLIQERIRKNKAANSSGHKDRWADKK